MTSARIILLQNVRSTFQQDNVRSRATGIGQTFLDKMFGCGPGLHVIQVVSLTYRKYVQSIAAVRLARYSTPVTTINGLRHLVEHAWAVVPADATQSLYDSNLRRITAVFAAGCVFSGY